MKKRRISPLIKKSFLTYLPSMMFLSFGFSLSEFADSIIVSKLIGEVGLFVVNACMPFQLIMNAICYLFCIGGGLRYAKLLGERREEEASRMFLTSMLVALAFSFLVFISMICFANQFAGWLTDDAKIIPELVKYIKVISFLSFVNTGLFGLSYFLIACGNPKLSMLITLSSNIFNICLDFVFISLLNMGIAGAGLATIVGDILGISLTLIFIRKSNLSIKLPNKNSFKLLFKSLMFGFGSAIGQLGLGAKYYTTNKMALVCGGFVLQIAVSIFMQVQSIESIFLLGFEDTYSPIASTYLGEEDIKSFKKTNILYFVTFIPTIFIVLLLCALFSTQLAGFYSVTNTESLKLISDYMIYFCLYIFIRGITIYFRSVFTVSDHKKIILLSTLLDGFLIVPLFIGLGLGFGIKGFMISYLIEPTITLLIVLITIFVESKKTKTALPFLTNDKEIEDNSLSLSFEANAFDACAASNAVTEYLSNKNIGKKQVLLSGMVVEEFSMYIMKESKKMLNMDIVVRPLKDEVLLLVRSDGRPLNGLNILDDEEQHYFSNKTVLNKITSSMNYSRLIGVNSVIVKINK